MRIPESQYSFDQFVEYLVENDKEVFGGERKQWLKIYLVYAKTDWKGLFSDLPQTQLGEILKICMHTKNLSKPVEFYVYEWGPGLLMFFTSSRKEDYEKTLSRFIRSRRGISEMWISPEVLTKLKDHLLKEYGARIYKFVSRTSYLSETPADLRPGVDRRLSYTGDDATSVIKEVLGSYRVLPESISFRVGNQKLQVTSIGMLRFLSVNELSAKILRDLIKLVDTPQSTILNVSSRIKKETETLRLGQTEISTSVIHPGVIRLPNQALNRDIIERFFKQEDIIPTKAVFDFDSVEKLGFSFIDTSIREGSFSFSAIVVDDLKGTMFGITGIADHMILVPMQRTTFESFVRFYQLVLESLDKEASFNVLVPNRLA